MYDFNISPENTPCNVERGTAETHESNYLQIFPDIEISSRVGVIYYAILASKKECGPYGIQVDQSMGCTTGACSNSDLISPNHYLSISFTHHLAVL